MVLFEPHNDPLKILPLSLKLFASIGFVPKLCMGYETIPQCFRSIAEGMFSFNTCVTIVLLPLRFGQFESLLQDLKRFTELVSTNEEYKQILVTLNTAIHKFTKYYFIFTNIIVVAMTCSSFAGVLYTYFLRKSNQSAVYPLIMEHRIYVLDAKRNLAHCFIHQVLILLALYILLVAFVAKAGAFCGSIRFCSTVLEIVALKIDRLSLLVSGEQYVGELREIILLHQLAIKCAKQLQGILMEILLAQFTGCVLIWCFMLYSVMISGITAEGITVMAMLTAFSTETFMFCLLGNELTLKGEQIGAAMYASNWYEQPVQIQKLIVPILQQSQQRIGISAAKFYYIDYNRYGLSLKTAYSFYLLLKDIF